MPKLLVVLPLGLGLAVMVGSPANTAPPDKKLLTREFCAEYCKLGTSTQPLFGQEKENFNTCANANLCVYNRHYYADEQMNKEWLKRWRELLGPEKWI